ncbi:MAG: hypothetical protein COC10_07140 [Sphingobium sp.]|nr:MAG: hypothetical protein COC10_07140 [Sphingobium sp.]
MKKSGREQMLSMARVGQEKVDKSIRPPVGYKVIDQVFKLFLDAYKDEFRRRVGTQEGCNSLAGEWFYSLKYYGDDLVLKAARHCIENNAVPPYLSAFLAVCDSLKAEMKTVPRNHDVGRAKLADIRKMVGLNGQEGSH